MQPSATSKQISNYLGHRADAEGLHTTAVKVEALLKAPVPTNVQEIHSFLGLINYYGKIPTQLGNYPPPLALVTPTKLQMEVDQSL